MVSNSKKRRRIVRYKKPININIGVIIFTLIFLYLGISCIIFLSKEKIAIYEVVKGESENIPGITATGIAIRSEQVNNAPSTGYINYYVKDGSRVSVGSTLYTIDENGDFADLLKMAATEGSMLTSDNLTEIKNDITSFVLTYDAKNFSNVYSFRSDLNTTLIECVNLNALDTINQTLASNGSPTLNLNVSDKAGIIELYTDGMEGLTVETVTSDLFDNDNYSKNVISRDKPVEINSPIYKTITDENWKIVIPLTEKQVSDYSGIDVVDLYFPTKDITTSAYFSIINNGGSSFGVIELKRYMIQFADTRYVEVQIIGDTTTGLKIPKTSVVSKDFYTIPSDYLTKGGDSNNFGFLVETISDTGESSAKFTEADIIEQKDGICYFDDSSIKEGSVIIQPNSSNKYRVESKAELTGVYNVNTGLTTFRHINILSEKNGYYIVESGTTYGLQVYDQIVLNAKLVKENQVIFK